MCSGRARRCPALKTQYLPLAFALLRLTTKQETELPLTTAHTDDSSINSALLGFGSPLIS